MSTTVPPTLAIPIKTRWLNNKAAVEVILGAPEDPRLMEALARDQPPTHDVELGTIAARAHVETDAIEFAGKGGSVRFRSEASAHAGVGLFMRGERLLNALGFDEEMGGRVAVELPPDPEDEDYYAALHWGYDIGAQADGKVALGTAGAITFGAQLDRKGLFAVARRFRSDKGMKSAVIETVGEWRLPGQVRTADALPAGTWIFCEVDGAVSFRVAPVLGYSFSWVRQLAAGTLAGDVGLKLDLGLQASLGLLASGKYCLVLSRESEARTLRLRLFS
jgi:hypothetical protein